MNKNIASKIFNVTICALIACIWIFFLWTKYDRQLVGRPLWIAFSVSMLLTSCLMYYVVDEPNSYQRKD